MVELKKGARRVDKTLHYVTLIYTSIFYGVKHMSTKNPVWGFTSYAETFSGRLAMYGFFIALVTEVLTGKGILGQLSAWFFVN
ncbi:hypothetical protein AM10699_17140 [Acaryochloris marina MBIC10699]|nr:hypothetical protein AM10699_17140 [Acaryochloris marina MBIC10699]